MLKRHITPINAIIFLFGLFTAYAVGMLIFNVIVKGIHQHIGV